MDTNTTDRSENVQTSGADSGILLSEWEYFCDRCYYDMYAVRPVGEKRWGYCFHLMNHDEAKGLAELLTKLSLPGRSGTHDVQQETGSVGTGGDSICWEHDGDILEVAKHLRECASSWEPKARLIGNCRAHDLAVMAESYLNMYTMVEYLANELKNSKEDLVGARYYANQLENLL